MATKKRGAVLCSSCRQLISAQEKRCPHCGAAAPTLFGLGPGLHALFRDAIEPVSLILGPTVVLFGLSLLLDPRCMELGIHLDFASPSSEALRLLGMTSGPALWGGRLWTLISASFLHGSLLHIVFNMMWLRNLGGMTAREFGPGRFLLIYVLSGVGCYLLSDLWSGAPTIGASGGLFGLMGALFAFGKRRGGTFGEAVRGQMLMWGGFAFFMGLAMPGVNNAGHVGGLITGLALGYVMPYAERQRETRAAQLGGLLMLVLAAGSVITAVFTGWSGFQPGQCP